jgi:ABC-2 type transport system permease protein
MIRLIIEKEIRELVGSTKFAITFGACALMILLAFYSGARNYQVSVAQYEAAQREDLRQLEGVTDWTNVRQRRIMLPPQPLAALVTGVANDIGRTVEVQGRGELTAEESRYGDDPVYAVFRFLDLDFVFQVVLSLFAILLAYDSVSGEKERGTLRLSFANAVPRAKYLFGKIIGSTLGLLLPLLIAILAGCLILPALGLNLGPDEWKRLALIVLAGLLYVSAFLTLAVMISSLTQKSSTSFLVLLVAWIFCVLIVPRTSVLLAGKAVDVPTAEYLASQKSRFLQQAWSEDRQKMSNFKPSDEAKGEEMFKEFNRFMSKLSEERDLKMKEFASRLNEDRQNKMDAQLRLSLGIARVSPAATFSLAATSLAGTSIELKQHYRKEAEGYQVAFANFIKEKTGMNPSGGMIMMRIETDHDAKPKPINPAELPAFQYTPMSLAMVGGSVIFDVGLLAFFNLLFFGCAFAAFLRYDVR